jgi:hypothetical protein
MMRLTRKGWRSLTRTRRHCGSPADAGRRPQPIRYPERVDWAADPSEITTQRVEGTFRLLGGHTKNPPVMGASGFLYAVLWPFRVGVRLPTQMNEGHRVRILAL